MNTKRSMTLFAVLIGLVGGGAFESWADTHYVSLAGTNDVGHSYSNEWSGAATEIQWAVDKSGSGDTVLVSNGTYNLTNQISIAANIIVRSFTEQGHGTNDTIINGNYPAYTNRCVYMSEGTLDAFTISNGFNAGTADNSGGGGVSLYGGTVMNLVKNCFIYRNCSSNETGNFCGGGGVYIYANPGIGTISNCTIVSNIVYNSVNANIRSRCGGGVYLFYGGTVVGSRISWNNTLATGGRGGGGAFMYNVTVGSAGGLTGCIVDNNTAGASGGGIYNSSIGSTPAIVNCLVSNNSNGGVYLLGGTLRDSTVVGSSGGYGVTLYYVALMSNCQVIANTKGGVFIQKGGGENVVANCTITRNQGPGWAAGGAAGIHVYEDAYSYPQLIKNCLIAFNTNSDTGGGIHLSNIGRYADGAAGLINCTIVSNQTANSGAGIHAYNTNNYIVNCIVYDNKTTDDNADEIYNNTADNTNNWWNNCVQPTPSIANTALDPNKSNITNNPLFVASDNYRLGNNSPCINAGMNQIWMTNSYDLDGLTRIRYGTVDMGAYELILNGTMYCFH